MRKREVSTIELPLESASFRLILGAKKEEKRLKKSRPNLYTASHTILQNIYRRSIILLPFRMFIVNVPCKWKKGETKGILGKKEKSNWENLRRAFEIYVREAL